MRKLWIGLSILFFPFSVPALLLARRRGKRSGDCFSRPGVECLGCPDLEYAFRKRGFPPLVYVEDALLVCCESGARTSVAQGRLRKALVLAKKKAAREEEHVQDAWTPPREAMMQLT
jgi:hypothetical protein